MIVRSTVDELDKFPGFGEMLAEYIKMADPDMPMPEFRKPPYQVLENEGRLGLFIALENCKIVGFVAVVKGYLPKFNIEVAITESLFVAKKYRKRGYGWRLIDAVEDYARINGLKYSFINVPDHSLNKLGLVLSHRNYSAKIHTYGKVLCS